MKNKLTMKQLCKRCGYIGELMEKHHKKYKSEGGSDANPNRIYYCSNCHDYIHAKDNILKAIKFEKKRIAVLEKRLEILDKLNSAEIIKLNGYQSYFKEFRAQLPQVPSPANKCVWGIS